MIESVAFETNWAYVTVAKLITFLKLQTYNNPEVKEVALAPNKASHLARWCQILNISSKVSIFASINYFRLEEKRYFEWETKKFSIVWLFYQ